MMGINQLHNFYFEQYECDIMVVYVYNASILIICDKNNTILRILCLRWCFSDNHQSY